MFKKMLAVLAAVVLVAGFTACSHVDTGTTLNGIKLTENDTTTIAHLDGEVWGLYFFHMLPLFTGSTNQIGKCAIFSDTVSLDKAVGMVTKKAKNMDATKLVNLHTEYTGTWWPVVITYKSYHVSGTAVK